MTADEAFCAEFGEGFAERVLAHAKRGTVIYAAVREMHNDDIVYGLVLLVHTARSSSGRGDRELCTKGVHETMGPADHDCPAHILDLLTPTANEEANAWRQRCRETLAARARRPTVRPGSRIRFTTPLEFDNGARLDTFEYVVGSRFRAATDTKPHDTTIYRIPHWRKRQFEIIADRAEGSHGHDVHS